MHVLYSILFFIGGIGLIVLGVWLSIKELKSFSDWNAKWNIGSIQGLGIAVIAIGIFLISQAI